MMEALKATIAALMAALSAFFEALIGMFADVPRQILPRLIPRQHQPIPRSE